MAGYTASLTGKVWKQHTCVACGCAYRYVLSRAVQGRGQTAEAAQAAARSNVSSVLTRAVDVQPCPECGVVQPDMVGQTKAAHHATLTGVAIVALLVCLGVWLLWDRYVTWLPWLGGGLGLLLTALHVGGVARSPNADLDANRDRARQAAAAGTLAVDQSGRVGAPRAVPGGLTVPQTIALAALVAGALAVPAPEMVRLLGRWPINPNCYPPVAGPGDTVRLSFPQFIIYAINSTWRANPTVRVANAAELGLENRPLPARSNDDTWGNTLSGKRSAQSSKPTLWLDVDIPAAPSLARRSLDLDMRLDVSYPQGMGNTFSNSRARFSPKAHLQLGPARAGHIYRALLLLGSLGGALLVIFAGFVLKKLAQRLQKQALPTKLFEAN